LNDEISAVKPKKFEGKKRLDRQNVTTKVQFFCAINQGGILLNPEVCFHTLEQTFL
jgi:hypothetical protein